MHVVRAWEYTASFGLFYGIAFTQSHVSAVNKRIACYDVLIRAAAYGYAFGVRATNQALFITVCRITSVALMFLLYQFTFYCIDYLSRFFVCSSFINISKETSILLQCVFYAAHTKIRWCSALIWCWFVGIGFIRWVCCMVLCVYWFVWPHPSKTALKEVYAMLTFRFLVILEYEWWMGERRSTINSTTAATTTNDDKHEIRTRCGHKATTTKWQHTDSYAEQV